MKGSRVALVILLTVTGMFAQNVPEGQGPLKRLYQDGEQLVYLMKGHSDDLQYEILATGCVKQDPAGGYVEEFGWSGLRKNGVETKLSEASLQVNQVVSLDPKHRLSLPSLAGVEPILIGPVTDFMTFYVDLWLAIRLGKLTQPGDHAYVEYGVPASWADGHRVLLGEGSMDFELTLTGIDQQDGSATLLVRHVPPKQPQIRLLAAWMKEPVSNTPNNWVQVSRKNGKRSAAVGKETIDVRLKISLVDGKILSGTMENRIELLQRVCEDETLTECGGSRPEQIVRRIEITLQS